MARKLFRIETGRASVVTLLLSVGVAGQRGAPQQSAWRTAQWRRTGGDGSMRVLAARSNQRRERQEPEDRLGLEGRQFRLHPRNQERNHANLCRRRPLFHGRRSSGPIVAADPGTGETLWTWRLDEGAAHDRRPQEQPRHVRTGPTAKESRILTVTPGYQLVSLDAKTGQPDVSFGSDGIVDLTKEVEKDANFDPTHRPLDEHLAAYGFRQRRRHPDRARKRAHPEIDEVPESGHDGLRRANREEAVELPYHSAQGRIWRGHVATPGRTSTRGTRAPGRHLPSTSSSGTVPAGRSADRRPVWRPASRQQSVLVVALFALDIKTGKRIWHYQLVHHDIWDFDMPAAPILADITVNGKPIKAVVQLTKSAFAYVFDRTNGQPVWPIEERPVPQTDVPGEWTAPTQPFPTKPPASTDRE